MPLRLRLALLFALGTAAVIAVAGVVFVLQLRISVEAALDPGLRTQLHEVVDEVALAGAPLSTYSELVEVSTPDGRRLAASPDAGPAPLLTPDQRRQALVGEVSFSAVVNGDRNRVMASSITVRGATEVVAVGTGTDVADAASERATTALLTGGPPTVLLAGVAAWLLAAAALRPVERMRRQAAEISDRDVAGRLAVPATRDEIAALGLTMNALLARLQGAVVRERAFVADAGHELRTPLAILRAELELAGRPGRSQQALVEAVALAGEETDRLIRLAEDLLLLARADDHRSFLRPAPLSLPDLLATVARAGEARAAERGVRIAVHGPAELPVDADPDRLRQALDNLLDNALRHAPSGSTVDLTASTPDRGRATVVVADRGPGFPPDFLARAFERFQRVEADRGRDSGGAGLGLSIVRAIAVAHGGRAIAANRAGGGAAVTVEIATTRDHPAD